MKALTEGLSLGCGITPNVIVDVGIDHAQTSVGAFYKATNDKTYTVVSSSRTTAFGVGMKYFAERFEPSFVRVFVGAGIASHNSKSKTTVEGETDEKVKDNTM